MKKYRTSASPLAALLLLAALPQAAHAASGTWNVDANGLWSLNTNWSSSIIADGSGSTANFTNDITADRTVSLDSARTLTNLVFSDSATATAGSWIIDNNSTPANTLTLAGTNPTITVNTLGTNATATISAVIAGTTGWIKAGTGTLVLSGANTFTLASANSSPACQHNAGTVIIASDSAFGVTTGSSGDLAASGLLSLGGPVTLQASGSARTVNNPVWLNGNTTTVSGTQSITFGGAVSARGGNATVTNNLTNSATLSLSNKVYTDYQGGFTTLTFNGTGDTNISGVIANDFYNVNGQNGSLTMSGSGTLTLSGANTYTGTTTVSSGTLTVSGANACTGNTSVSASGTLTLASAGSMTFVPTANGVCNKITGAGTANLNGTLNINLAGATLFAGNSWTLVDVTTKNYNLTAVTGFTGPVSGVWTKVDGANTWTFTESTGVLLFSGPTILLADTLLPVSTTYGTASATPTSFHVSGSGLTGNLTVTPPSGYEVSLSSGSGYTTSLSITASGTLASTLVYVRLAATTAVNGGAAYTGNITVSGGGANSKTIATVSSFVAKANATLTVTPFTGNYDGLPHSATAVITGVNGETGATVGTFSAPSHTAVGTYPNEAYSFTGAANYNNIGIFVAATGGTITTYTSGATTYKVHTFTSSGSLPFTTGGSVSYLVVAGGGGGGRDDGGGGGAGGLLTGTTTVTNSSYTVTIGSGGAGGTNSPTLAAGGIGGNSVFGSFTTTGGGGGSNNSPSYLATSGGSGGGGSSNANISGGTGIAGQGNNGGATTSWSGAYGCGGGGGAGAVGGNGSSSGGGAGGAGLSNSITGAATFYAGGGGGGTYTSTAAGTGGSGVGGNGGKSGVAGGAGTTNKGGGGGGGGKGQNGGAGGTGVVIVSYASADTSLAVTTTISAAGGPTITGAATAAAFTTTYGTASTAQTFAISGSALTADITATAPTGYQVSNNGTTYGGTATFTQSGGSASGTLSVRLSATAAVSGTYNSQNIVLSSTGAFSVNVTTASSGNSVSPAALTVTAADSKTYGSVKTYGSGSSAYSITAGSLKNSDAVSTVTITDTNSGGPATAAANGTYNLTPAALVFTTGSAANYTITYTPGLLTVSPAALTITANNQSKTFNTTQTTPVTGSNAYLITAGSLKNSDAVSTVTLTYGAGGLLATDAVGSTSTITPGAAVFTTGSAANYTLQYNPGTLTVVALPSVITLSDTLVAVNTTYGTASATPTSFHVSGSGITGAPGNLTVTPPSGYEVSLSSGSGYSTSLSVPYSSDTLASTLVYVRLAATAGVAGSPYSGNITVSGGGASSQTLATASSTVAKATATVVVTPYTATYDGNPKTATVTSITGVNGETDATVGTVTLTNTTHTTAGTYASDSWYFAGTANYNNIGRPITTITVQNPSFETTGSALGGPWFTFGSPWSITNSPSNYQVIDAVAGGGFSSTVAGGGTYVGLINVDDCPITAPLVQNLGTSVTAGDTLSVTFYIGRALGAAAGGAGVAYFDVAGTKYTMAFDTSAMTAGTWQLQTMTKTITNSGNLTLGFYGTTAHGIPAWLDLVSNVSWTSSAGTTQTLTNTINPKALSITAPTIAAKNYTGTATAGAVTVGTLSGFVGSETVTATGVAADYSSANAGSYSGTVVTYTLANGTNSGLAANYSLATGTATGVINPMALSITAPTIAAKNYNGTATAGAVTVGTLSGFVGSETVTATGAAADYSSANVGTYTGNVVTYTLANGTNGGLAANYSLATGTATGVINKATPTATLAVNNSPVTYDGSAKAATLTLSANSVAGTMQNILTGGAATQTAAGTYAVTANFVPTDTTNYNTLTAQSAGNFIILTTYNAWAGGTFTNAFTDQDPTHDPDSDTLTNLQEYAFGTDPTTGASGPGSIIYVAGGAVTTTGSPVASNLAVGEGVDYRAVFGRRKDYTTAGLTYTVQFSVDMLTWTNSTIQPTVLTGAGNANPSAVDAVSVPYPFFISYTRNGVPGYEKPTFFRVSVSSSN